MNEYTGHDGQRQNWKGPQPQSATIGEGLSLVLDDYTANGRHSRADAERRIRKHLLRRLPSDLELTRLTIADLLRYAGERRGEGASAASVNREVALLRRACTLAGVAWPALRWRKLQERSPRAGFFERAQLDAVLARLPPPVAAVVQFLHFTGWRKREAFTLRWSQVDFDRGEVTLLAGTTKTGEGRVWPMFPQLRALLEGQAAGRRGEYVFHRDGVPIRSIYAVWNRVCRAAGVPGRFLHDFRRTAARNLIEAGVDKQVAMQLLGHKTPSIFDRYRIVDGRNLRDAAEKLGKALG